MDLFENNTQATDIPPPLAGRMRSRSLEEFVGHEKVIKERLEKIKEKKRPRT